MKKIPVIGQVIAGIVFLIVIIAFFPMVIIGSAQRGVVFNTATGVENRILGEGTHFRVPFYNQSPNFPSKSKKLTSKPKPID